MQQFFSINVVSIKFHEKWGFRKIRYRERIDKDKFWKMVEHNTNGI